MRIKDIAPSISDELNEGLLDKIFAKGAEYLAKPQAIAALKAKWAEEIATLGKRVSKPADVIGAKLAADPEIIKAARASAAKGKLGAANAANKAAVAKGVGTLLAGANEKLQTLIKWGIVVDPILQYNIKMKKWDAQLASGAIDQATYDDIRKKELSISIAAFATGLAGSTFIKGFGSASSWLTSWSPTLTSIIRGITTAGQAATVYWLNSEQGRHWISYLVFNDLYDISDILGKPTTLIDQFKSMVPGFNGPPAAQGGTAAAPTGTTTGTASAAAPAAQQSSMLKGTNMQSINTGPDGPVDIAFK